MTNPFEAVITEILGYYHLLHHPMFKEFAYPGGHILGLNKLWAQIEKQHPQKNLLMFSSTPILLCGLFSRESLPTGKEFKSIVRLLCHRRVAIG